MVSHQEVTSHSPFPPNVTWVNIFRCPDPPGTSDMHNNTTVICFYPISHSEYWLNSNDGVYNTQRWGRKCKDMRIIVVKALTELKPDRTTFKLCTKRRNADPIYPSSISNTGLFKTVQVPDQLPVTSKICLLQRCIIHWPNICADSCDRLFTVSVTH